VGDDTGEVLLKYWGNGETEKVETLYSGIDEGCVIDVDGVCVIDEYTGKRAISVDVDAGHGLRVVDPSEYEKKEFLPRAGVSSQDLIARFNSLIKRISNPHIKAILSEVLDEERIKRFVESPCTIRHNHSYLGGLIEHTVNIGEICCLIHKHYPDLDLDLMIAGALLRNIGKVYEFDLSTTIERNDKGNLIGHAVISDEILIESAKNIPDIPEDLILKLRHIILSSGRKDWGTLVPPKIPEAMAVYLAEQLDIMLNTFIRIHGEAFRPGERWIYSRELGYTVFARGGDEV
jgi:3'-5' exoribonuclease